MTIEAKMSSPRAADSLYEEVLGEQGYSCALRLTPDERTALRSFISAQYAETMRQAIDNFESLEGADTIEQYHKLSRLIEHRSLWPKRNRCLPQQNIQAFRQFSIFEKLRGVFGDFTFSNIIYENNEVGDHEEVYWRLVRPNEKSDVGALHTDRWFNDLLHLDGRIWPAGSYTLKVWIAVSCTPGLSGLAIAPGSHRREWEYATIMVDGNPRPKLLDAVELQCIETTSGDVLTFPEETLHGGVVNRSDETRVSAEVTLVFPKRLPFPRPPAGLHA